MNASLTATLDQDIYFKKLVPLRYRGRILRFRVAQDLFGSLEVDVGTKLLLRTLVEATPSSRGSIFRREGAFSYRRPPPRRRA